MKIETKFNPGDSVVFLHNDAFTRRTISRINIEIKTDSKLITYYFEDLRSDQFRSETYKYEDELATSKEELAANAREQ